MIETMPWRNNPPQIEEPMTEYFDRYEWKPQLFQTPEELNAALEQFAVKDKKIKAIHTIGIAHNMQPWAYMQSMRTTLAGVGVSYYDIDSGRYPNIDKTLLPCEVKLCEPVVFVFEDDSTLEIKPNGDGGLFMSANRISSSVKDGLNHSNVDSEVLFKRVIGSSIRGIWTTKTRTITEYTSSGHGDQDNTDKWKLSMSGDYDLYFCHRWGGWYQFGMTSDNIGCQEGKIRYAIIKKAANNYRQIPIVEGHDGSSYFWIMPVRHVEVSDDNWYGIEECREQEISIEEDDIGEFLYFFLEKYFDPDYPYGQVRDRYCGSGFEWNLEYNIYTYETIRKMLDEIELCARLLETDFDNPALTDFKKGFHSVTFDPDENRFQKRLTDEEEEHLIRDNIGIALDFYDRFVRRMRKMMQAADDYELISFMGP